MYIPAHFAAEDAEALIARLARGAAGVLVTNGPDGLVATHMPILWDREARVLTGHVARANPHHTYGAGQGLVVLSGPEAYVSPNLYPSKAEHGKAVPTWNYEAVHFSGSIEWFDDPARLEGVVRRLSTTHESGRAHPWSLDDAPAAYVSAMLRAIVGMEMRVERIEAKRKLSQNKTGADYEGVASGLESEHDEASREVGRLMRELSARRE